MMSILQRYIAKTILKSTLLIVSLVVGISYLLNFLGELRDIGTGEYGLIQAITHSILELPHNVSQFFPMLVLLGGLMGMSVLAANQELAILRISGMSIYKILRSIFKIAIPIIIFGLIIGEVLSPKLHYQASKQKFMAQNRGQAVATPAGIWLHEGNNFFHVDQTRSHQLIGVTRYEFDANHHLLATYFAKQMNYRDGKWILQDVVKTTFVNDKTQNTETPIAEWKLAINPNLLNNASVEPEEMTLANLTTYIKHLNQNDLQSHQYQVNFWQRILQPLTILVMLFLAIPFVFVAPRSVTVGRRVLIGVIVGFVFYVVSSLLGQLSVVFQFSPFLAAFTPILLFAFLGYFLMLRVA